MLADKSLPLSKPRETLLVWGQDGESASLLKDELLATCTCS